MAAPDAPRVHTLGFAADHAAFDGHFPGMPILPGAALLDEALQVIGADRRLDLTQWRITAAKFLSTVRPGEPLRLEHVRTPGGALRFEVHAADRCTLTGTLAPVDSGGPG